MRVRPSDNLFWAGFAAFAGGLIAFSPLWISALLAASLGLLFSANLSPIIALQAALTLAPLRALLSRVGHWPFPLDIGQVAFVGLFLVWLAHVIRNHKVDLPARWKAAIAPLAIFVFFLLLHGFFAGITFAWLQEWLKWLSILILVLISLSLCERYGGSAVLSAVLLAAMVNALLGLMQFTGLVESAPHFKIDGQFTRAYGSYEQPNPFAGLMGMTAPLAVMATWGFACRAKRSAHQNDPPQSRFLHHLPTLLSFICSFCLVMALLLSWSRGAWLGTICGTVALVTAIPRKRWASGLIFVTSLLIAVAIWFSGALPTALDARLRSAVHELIEIQDVRGVDFDANNYALVERVAHWQAAIRMATDRPYLGYGLGSYEEQYAEYRLANWPDSLGHAHNYYLNMLAETGLVGLFAYLLLSITILIWSWRARAHPDPLARSLAVGVFVSWLYFCIHSLSDHLYVNHSFLILGAIWGLLLHIRCQQQSQRVA
ncbi:MAG: O-antigen ligase family protein [Anaerolineaceae bacterium]|nr:O-antigen ligase family protein [Anaerolineaceae bacterium]